MWEPCPKCETPSICRLLGCKRPTWTLQEHIDVAVKNITKAMENARKDSTHDRS